MCTSSLYSLPKIIAQSPTIFSLPRLFTQQLMLPRLVFPLFSMGAATLPWPFHLHLLFAL